MTIICVHTGNLAISNGVKSPLTVMKNIREVIKNHGEVHYSTNPEEDRIDIEDDCAEVVIELLILNLIPYKLLGTHSEWQGIVSAKK